jgi:aquaporin Z
MLSACFFGAMLFSPQSAWYAFFPSGIYRDICMGTAMGATALFIFYSPWTSHSGSQINPAVTTTFLILNKVCRYDALFYMLFQVMGGTLAVLLMQWLMGNVLIAQPVNSVVTIPGKAGTGWAALTELLISFITMSMVLFTSGNKHWKKYTRIIAACLVCIWVIVAGPVSGFGMNPARSFASAVASGTWTAFWIYIFIPLAGMLLAATFYKWKEKRKKREQYITDSSTVLRKKLIEPLEFML